MTIGVVVLGHEPGAYGTINPTIATSLDPASLVNTSGQIAVEAFLSAESYPVRFRIDGGVATANNGHSLVAGEKITIRGNRALHNLSIIDTADGPSTVRITILF